MNNKLNNQELEVYLNLTNSIYLILDKEANILFINEVGSKLLGLPSKELIGLNFAEKFLPNYLKAYIKNIIKEISEKKLLINEYVENEIININGETLFISWRNNYVEEDGKVSKIICSGEDITEKRKIKSNMEEKDERLKAIFDFSPLGVVIFSKFGEFLESNISFQKMLGYDFDEIRFKKYGEIVASDFKEESNILFDNLIDNEIGSYKITKQYVKKNGERIWVNVTASSIKNEKNEILYILAIIEDITQMKKTQERLKENEQMLHHQSKMAAMGEMLENIAHQWRQPLSVVTTSASSIKLHKELGTLEDDFMIEALDAIVSSSKYLSQTIDDFRDFFRPNKQKNSFNLRKVYKKALKLVSSKLKNKDIEVIENCEDIEIFGFENELMQVIINLISNCKDALLDNIPVDRYIFIRLYKKDNFAYFEILDNANGIPNNLIHKIFEPYFTTKHKSQGTGIGLYMCEEILKKHMDGEITVKNKDFEFRDNFYTGAKFTLKFPIQVKATASDEAVEYMI